MSIQNEILMLNGNIARMSITDDLKELDSMYDWAIKRLSIIHCERMKERRLIAQRVLQLINEIPSASNDIYCLPFENITDETLSQLAFFIGVINKDIKEYRRINYPITSIDLCDLLKAIYNNKGHYRVIIKKDPIFNHYNFILK